MPQARKLSFDRFVLDQANASLTSAGNAVPVAPKVFELLCYLVSRPGQLVTKGQLLDAVWQRRFVSESVLKGHISDLRQVLGDQAKAPRYIETVTRRGYRFIAPLRDVVDADPPSGRGSRAALTSQPAIPVERTPFVGRASTMEELERHWQRALAGERQLVFVCGEAGIGKTALVDTFFEHVATKGTGGLRARCVEHFGEGEGYLPLVEALSERCRADADLIAALRRHAPTWLMQMPRHLGTAERDALQREVLGATRERMLREFCEFVETLSEQTPFLLVVEDLHWSDYATIDVLSLLARRADRARLLVLGSYRPFDVAHRMHPVARVRQELGMRGLCSELRLDTLSVDEVASYLALRLGGSKVADDVVQAIHRRSDGHPLFLVNLVDYLAAAGKITEEDGQLTWQAGGAPVGPAIPGTLKYLLQRQFESLAADEERCIEAASVVGAQFSAALVAAALNADLVEAEAACERLVRRELWLKSAGVTEWPDGTVAGSYAFLHAIYVEAVYQRLAPAQCARYHRNIGERLSAAYGNDSREVAAQLALHFEQARDHVKAISSLRLAADHMVRRWAFGEALGYVKRALQLTDRLPLPAQAGTRTELLLQQAAVRRSVGDLPGAAEDLKALIASARATGDRRHEIHGLVDLSRVLVWVDRQRCLECASQAVALSQTLDDDVVRAMAGANYAGWSLLWQEWRDDQVGILDHGLALARRTNDAHILNSRLTLHSLVDNVRSNYRSAQALSKEGMALAETVGDGYQFAMSELSSSWALTHLGTWGEARRLLEKSRLLWSKNQNPRVVCMRLLSLALVSVEAGDFPSALRQCDEASGLNPAQRDITAHFGERIVRGRAYAGLGDFARALTCFAEVTRRIEEDGVLLDSYFFPLLYLAASECRLAQGDLPGARQEACRLCEIAEKPPERTYLAHGHRLLAEITMSVRAWGPANAEIDKALEIVNAGDVPLAAWRVHATAAALFDHQGRSSDAATQRRRGMEVIDAIATSLEPADPWRIALHARAAAAGLTIQSGMPERRLSS
jgi:DNA-binding winged helix-turn-helix (wHTH) protein/tetratricopeptide (TPR) repeat protein